jgi:hypothetical protein
MSPYLKAWNLASSCRTRDSLLPRSLDCEPHLACSLYRFLNDLMELEGEGAENPSHHDVVQSSPIDRRIGDVGKDVVIKGVAMKREKHEVTLPLVVER